MVKYLVIIAFLSVSWNDISGTYSQTIEKTSIIESVTKKWELTLNRDSSFRYAIHERYGVEFDSTWNKKGTWEVSHDTLTLKTFSFPYIIEFFIKGDSLIPIKEKEVHRGYLMIKLDYLRKKC